MTTQRRADWANRLPAIARMRKAGRKWDEIATYYGVSKRAILNVSHRFADQLDEHAKSLAGPVGVQMSSPVDPVATPAVEPEIVIEGDRTIKRYPPMWAEGTGFGATARPRGKPKRSD